MVQLEQVVLSHCSGVKFLLVLQFNKYEPHWVTKQSGNTQTSPMAASSMALK